MIMTKNIYKEWMVHLNNTCEITIVIRTPELTVDGKCLSVKIIY